MKKFLLVWVGLFVCSGFVFADPASVTQQHLKETMDQSLEILKNAELSYDEKMFSFEALLKERCHSELMAKLVLGRTGWSKLSEEQHPEFISLFIQMVTRTYYSKMDMADVSDVVFSYKKNIELSAKKRLLETVVEDESGSYHVDYKFALIGEDWGIYDLQIEGVSLLASYRSEYSDYLKQHSGTDLIEMLRIRGFRRQTDSPEPQAE